MSLLHNIEEDKKRFKFLNIIRISILLSLLFATILILFLIDSKLKILPISLLIFTATIISFLNYFFLYFYSLKTTVYIQLTTDIIFITVMVYLSGGINSPFYFLYLLPILISANFLKKRETILTASISFVLFGVISELMYMELIPSNIINYQSTISISSFIYNLMMSFIAFLSISIAGSFYFTNIKEKGEELHTVKTNLENLALLNHTVIEKMEHGFITAYQNGKIISSNKKAEKLINLSNINNIIRILNLETRNDKIQTLTDKNTQIFIKRMINNRVLNISISLVSDITSYKKILVFLISDLTDIMEIERKLKEKEHLALIGEMAAGIAHEIRNPLASISGSVQFLSKEIDLQDEHLNLMNIIVKESKRLSDSIEEFLAFTKSTPINKTVFNLSKLLNDNIELLKISSKNIKFIKKYNEDIMINADEKKIKQVIWNLLSNSIKAIEKEGIIELTIIEGATNISFYIKDNGIGINKGELEKIFTPFYSKFTSGIGLGMSIIKRIIDEHNAGIKVTSDKNHGTEIKIVFGALNEK